MKKKRSLLEELKLKQKSLKFKGGLDFVEKNQRIRTFLEEHIYPQQEIGAALNGDGLLNGHGKKHVDDVIDHISKLLLYDYHNLNIYEIFLLLTAAQIHDIGNMNGRVGHEKRIASIIQKCPDFELLDEPTRHYAIVIAEAHGGRTSKGDKDTVSSLRRIEQLGGEDIRPRALAALLRLADELADNFTRANVDADKFGRVPKKNLLYHKYSSCLQPVKIEGVTLSFKYFMSFDLAKTKFVKIAENGKEYSIYLFDEILLRLQKVINEMEYCVKHGSGLFHFEGVNATVTVFTLDSRKELLSIPIRFKCCGYPSVVKDINDLLEEPIKDDFSTGKKMANYLVRNYSKLEA